MSAISLISKFNYLCEKRPYLFVALLLTVLVVMLFFIPWLLTFLNINDYLPALIGELCASALALLFLIWLDWWEDLGYTARLERRDLPLFVLPIVCVVLPMLVALVVLIVRGALQVPSTDIYYFALQALLIAFLEESYYRGLILRALLSQGMLMAVFFSALFFTLAHMAVIFSALDGFYVCAEILFMFAWGCVFAALRLRTGTLWPLIVLNGVSNFSALIVHENQGGLALFVSQTYAWSVWSSLGFALILLGYSCWLLQPLCLQSLSDCFSTPVQLVDPADPPVEPSEPSEQTSPQK